MRLCHIYLSFSLFCRETWNRDFTVISVNIQICIFMHALIPHWSVWMEYFTSRLPGLCRYSDIVDFSATNTLKSYSMQKHSIKIITDQRNQDEPPVSTMKMVRSPMIISIRELYLEFFFKKFLIISQKWYNIKNKLADRSILWCYTALTSWTHPLICILWHFPAYKLMNLWLMLFTPEFLDARMAPSPSQTWSMKWQWSLGKSPPQI